MPVEWLMIGGSLWPRCCRCDPASGGRSPEVSGLAGVGLQQLSTNRPLCRPGSVHRRSRDCRKRRSECDDPAQVLSRTHGPEALVDLLQGVAPCYQLVQLESAVAVELE
jgi:hypothetical protein